MEIYKTCIGTVLLVWDDTRAAETMVAAKVHLCIFETCNFLYVIKYLLPKLSAHTLSWLYRIPLLIVN